MEIPFHGRFTTKWTWVSGQEILREMAEPAEPAEPKQDSQSSSSDAGWRLIVGPMVPMVPMVHDHDGPWWSMIIPWFDMIRMWDDPTDYVKHCETLVKPIFVFFYHCDFGFAVLHASARPQRVDFILFLVSPYRLASDSCCSSSTILVG